MVNILVSREAYDKVFNHLHAPLEGKVLILTTAKSKVLRIGRLCLGENNQGSVAKGIGDKEQWEGPEFQDTTSSAQEREAKIFTFYRMEEDGECYFTPFYVGGLHTYDGEINLKSFMRLAEGVANFRNGVITIHPEPDPFLDDSKETKKFKDDWDHLLNIDFGYVQEINNTGMSPFALAIDICKRFSLLEEERPVIDTMAYSDKYTKILDGIVMDKFKLDGEIKKGEEEAIKQVKG
ncbi:hypothetical protein Tco_0275988 [Tanacetum coccineum]